jgi:hypothetical protein
VTTAAPEYRNWDTSLLRMTIARRKRDVLSMSGSEKTRYEKVTRRMVEEMRRRRAS